MIRFVVKCVVNLGLPLQSRNEFWKKIDCLVSDHTFGIGG